jgi:signal transduction histidine kinase
VARQLESPVATMRAQAARLALQAQEPVSPAAAREVAVRIVEQADRMAEWVLAILDVQRVRLGKAALDLQPLDLLDLAGASADEFRQEMHAADLELHGSRPAPRVLGDRRRLEQVMVGLLHNASRNAPSAKLALHARVQRARDGHARATLAVCDASRGIKGLKLQPAPETALDLDLYVAREVARMHGGELWTAPSELSAAALVLPVESNTCSR